MGIGFGELLLIFFIILILFGAKRLPEVAESMGRAVKEFKNAKDEIASPSATSANTVSSDSMHQDNNSKDTTPEVR